MKEDLYNLYDRIINKTLVNIYSLSKEDKKILLTNFNYEDKEDKTILEIAKIAQSLWNFNSEISCSFFDYLKIKKQNKNFNIKRCRRYSDKKIDVKDVKNIVSRLIKSSCLDDCKKLKNPTGDDGYVVRADSQMLVLLPDEPEQIEAIMQGAITGYIKIRGNARS